MNEGHNIQEDQHQGTEETALLPVAEKSKRDYKVIALNILWIIWWLIIYVGSIVVVVMYSFVQKRLIPAREGNTEIVGKDYTLKKAYFGLLLHIIGGTIGLFVGPLQFQQFIRKRSITTHKVTGYIYYIGMVLGMIGAIWLLPFAAGGMTNKFGFGMLAAVWLVCNGTAFFYIKFAWNLSKDRRIQLHREWMIRSYAATSGAITLRIWLFTLLMFNIYAMKLQFREAFIEMYQTVSWLGWVPNMIIAELYIRWAYSPEIPIDRKE